MDSSAAPFFSEVVVLALVQEGLDGGVEDGRLWVKVYGLKDRLTAQKHGIGKNATNKKIGGGARGIGPNVCLYVVLSDSTPSHCFPCSTSLARECSPERQLKVATEKAKSSPRMCIFPFHPCLFFTSKPQPLGSGCTAELPSPPPWPPPAGLFVLSAPSPNSRSRSICLLASLRYSRYILSVLTLCEILGRRSLASSRRRSPSSRCRRAFSMSVALFASNSTRF